MWLGQRLKKVIQKVERIDKLVQEKKSKILESFQALKTSVHISKGSWTKDQFQDLSRNPKCQIQEEKIDLGFKENNSIIVACNQEESLGPYLKVDECLAIAGKMEDSNIKFYTPKSKLWCEHDACPWICWSFRKITWGVI